MRRASPFLAVLALAACSDERPPASGQGPAPAPGATAPARPAEPASYVGRWAARPELCQAGAWTFEPGGVTTAGEVACDFQEVAPEASGWRVKATCVAQAPPQAHDFSLTLTDPAPPQSMTVTGGPWDGPVTLVRCPA